jgi:cell wall assembly regulator SMI1
MKLMLILFLLPVLTTATVSVARRTRETTALAIEHFVSADIKLLLLRLDASILQNDPVLYATLQPPLTDAQILALEKKYDTKVPAELKILYRWKNGQRQDNHTRSLFGNKTFMSLEEALLNRDELNDLATSEQVEDQFKIKNWWRVSWIPIFENGGGDYLCYDTEGTFTGKPNQIVDYYHGENYRRVVSPNLTDFLEAIVNVVDKKVEDEDDHTRAHHPGYPKQFNLVP